MLLFRLIITIQFFLQLFHSRTECTIRFHLVGNGLTSVKNSRMIFFSDLVTDIGKGSIGKIFTEIHG